MPKRKGSGASAPPSCLQKAPRTGAESTKAPAPHVPSWKLEDDDDDDNDGTTLNGSLGRSAQQHECPACAPGNVSDVSDSGGRESFSLPAEVEARASIVTRVHTSSAAPRVKRTGSWGTGNGENGACAPSTKRTTRPAADSVATKNQGSGCSAGPNATGRNERWDAMYERLRQFKSELGYVPTATETVQVCWQLLLFIPCQHRVAGLQ